MDPTPAELERIARLVDAVDRAAPGSTTHPALFCDSAWFDAERRWVLGAGWVAVGRTEDVANPNEFLTVDIAGEPCIVVRGRDGDLHALSNVCRHRSTVMVAESSGSTPSIQCPYHLWTYSHEGDLRSAPGMNDVEGFDREHVCLPRFAVDEWHGFVFVNVDGAAAPLNEAAPTLDALLTEQRVAEMRRVGGRHYPSPWNWKVSVENFLESYHHRAVHPETLQPTYPGEQSFVLDSAEEPWSGIDHVSVDDRDPFIVLAAFPTLLIAISRGFGVAWFRLEPEAVDHTSLTIEALVLPEFADDPEVGAGFLDVLHEINEEDVRINAATAAGLRSAFAAAGAESPLEGANTRFRRWLVDRMRPRVG